MIELFEISLVDTGVLWDTIVREELGADPRFGRQIALMTLERLKEADRKLAIVALNADGIMTKMVGSGSEMNFLEVEKVFVKQASCGDVRVDTLIHRILQAKVDKEDVFLSEEETKLMQELDSSILKLAQEAKNLKKL